MESLARQVLARPDPSSHLMQLYESDSRLLEALELFVMSGLERGEPVVVIATQRHLDDLHRHAGGKGLPLDRARTEGRYLPLEAEETLSRFIVDGWPNAKLFEATVMGALERVRPSGRGPVRAYGEMVAVLMRQGNPEATLRLEQLWGPLCEREQVTLFCGYPRAVFDSHPGALRLVCEAHGHVVPA